uniref:Uncharacterized protein n=1 Tax=Ditylenchus dipsaci TaxID=166011 RepID=A0A915EVA0_9BILA
MFGENWKNLNSNGYLIQEFCLVSWAVYSMSVVILALNRCIELHSKNLADTLFAGRKAFLWMIPLDLCFDIRKHY